MSITVAHIITDSDTYIADSSTNTVTAAQRLAAITEGTAELAQRLNNEHQIVTYDFDFLDSVNYYKITTGVPDLTVPYDLTVRDKEFQDEPITRKSPMELRIEIGEGSTEESYALEWRDSDLYMVVIHDARYKANQIATFDSITGDGTWALDETNSDGTNLTVDSNEKKQGAASLNFDADVSQSGNNLITLSNSTIAQINMTDDEDLSSHIVDVYIPDVTNFTSVTLYWGSDSSNYWSGTATTDIDGAAFIAGWNEVKIDWADATKTSSPDVTKIDYLRVDYNYGAGQGDDTDFRIDNWRLAQPEKLRLHYLSWNVGTDTNGTDLSTFAATTDIPFFSGKYDHYRWFVAHKAAAVLFRAMSQNEEAQFEDFEADRSMNRFNKMFPKSKTHEMKNFKAKGINFNK